MDNTSLIEAVRVESAGLALALANAAADDLVPTCEGWKVADLAGHVGGFCGFWTHVLCEGTGRPKTPFSEPPAGEDLAPWFAELSGYLIDQLTTTPPGTKVWTWFDADHTASFVTRRRAHELAVHRYDAQSSSGSCAPIAMELALDGINEIFDVLIGIRRRPGLGTGRQLALRSTDAGSDWVVTLGRDGIDVDRQTLDEPTLEHCDMVVMGTASDLELMLYHRPTLSPVDVHGDYTVQEEWHRDFTF